MHIWQSTADMSGKFDSFYWEDFVRFSGMNASTLDIDAIYHVVRHRVRAMDLDQAIWYVLIYLAWYDIGSGEFHFQKAPHPEESIAFKEYAMQCYPMGTARRGMRPPGILMRHFENLREIHAKWGSWWEYFTKGFSGDKHKDFVVLQDNVTNIFGNGPWAGHKTAEVFEKTLDFPVIASDMGGHGNLISEMPRRGLELFFGHIKRTDHFIAAAEMVYQKLNLDGVRADIAEVETHLCDFASLVRGRHYVGKDTDETMTSLDNDWCEQLWASRAAVMERECLGEHMGWKGVDKKRLKMYQFTRQILHRKEPMPNFPEEPWHVPKMWR